MTHPTRRILAILLIILSAYSVFHVKYRVKELSRDYTELNRQIAQDKEAVHVLNAEWAYLNQPSRLKLLAERYLNLRYIAASQVKSVENMYIAAANQQENLEQYPMDSDPALKPLLVGAGNYD